VSVAASQPLEEATEREAPRKARSHSGRLLLRMPESLHADLARAADRAGVSLNQFITTALAEVVGDRAKTKARPDKETGPRSRTLTLLLALNLAIVAAAGIVAILLLVSAWR
jgi:RNA polymerase sigma-B factor